jgi:glycosyltransferase involved in cell wall biosynthesis
MVVNGVGLDTAAISRVSDPGPGGKEFEAVFVGRHDSEKGIFDLIRIWKIVTSRFPAARLLMIGSCNPNNKARLESLIEQCGLRDNVHMMGTIGDDEKYSLMKRSKVCVFPSFVEEWGLVPQEALACGLPVIVYDLPVYGENIADCDAVFRLPAGDLEGMAERVAELLSEGAYLAYQFVGPEYVERFSWEGVAESEFSILFDSWESRPDATPEGQAGC